MSPEHDNKVIVNGVEEVEKHKRGQGRRKQDTHDGPKWMDRFFFSDILRKDYGSFKVITYKLEPANKKGENYASLIYRIKIMIENNINGLETKSFIAKVAHNMGMSAEMVKIFNVFPKETEMYDVIIPEFEKMFKRIGEDVQFGPKCLLANSEPTDFIIMDDLSTSGYRTSNRLLGLDMNHCKLALEKLAKFHAASAVYYETKEPFKPMFNYGIFAEHMKPVLKQMFQVMNNISYELVPLLKYSDSLKVLYDNWEDGIFNRIYDIVQRDDKRFNVLTHGDLWSNNIMFHYDETGNVQSCLLVDYQMCNYNSPVMDLLYFIFTSVQTDIRMENIDFFIQFYHQHLASSLKKLGYKGRVPKLLELQEDFLHKGLFGLQSAFGTLAIALAPGGDDSDMDNMMSADEKGLNMKRKVFTNPVYVNALNTMLPYFYQKGFLEYP